MIPYRDENRSRTFPIVVIVLIAANLWAFWQEVKLGDAGAAGLLFRHGLVPQRVVHTNSWDAAKAAARSLVTSMFLHGGLLHLVCNMWFLWLFGDNVEDRLGHARFIVFYLLCGVMGALAHVFVHPSSPVPCIGASGAISGVLGAYMALFPGARIRVIVPVLVILPLFVSVPAWIFIGIWFIYQLLHGLSMAGGQSAAAGVAWWVHVGGFLAGLLLISQLLPERRARRAAGRST